MSSDEDRLARQIKFEREAQRYMRMGEAEFADRKDRVERAKSARREMKILAKRRTA